MALCYMNYIYEHLLKYNLSLSNVGLVANVTSSLLQEVVVSHKHTEFKRLVTLN